jgi:hypothetical protein
MRKVTTSSHDSHLEYDGASGARRSLHRTPNENQPVDISIIDPNGLKSSYFDNKPTLSEKLPETNLL